MRTKTQHHLPRMRTKTHPRQFAVVGYFEPTNAVTLDREDAPRGLPRSPYPATNLRITISGNVLQLEWERSTDREVVNGLASEDQVHANHGDQWVVRKEMPREDGSDWCYGARHRTAIFKIPSEDFYSGTGDTLHETIGGDDPDNGTFETFRMPRSGLRNLKAGTVYWYWVKTFGERGVAWSKPYKVTTPGTAPACQNNFWP